MPRMKDAISRDSYVVGIFTIS